MDSKGIASTQFADMCEIPRPTVSQILNGRNKKISDEIIRKIHSAFPSLSVSWLMFGEGDMESISNIQFSAPQKWQKSDIDGSRQAENQKDGIVGGLFSQGITTDSEKLNSARESSTPHFQTIDPQPAAQNAAQNLDEEIKAELHGSTDSESNNIGPTVISKQTGCGSVEKKNGKRIVNIMVFYDDNTFESFIPSNEKGSV